MASSFTHCTRHRTLIMQLLPASAPIDDKKVYVNFVRAQMFVYHLAILFYNCLSINGCEKFKELLENYEFLEDMDLTLLFDWEHKSLCAPQAFGKMLVD
ncbi:putative phage abortive infection protein [Geomonas paludis]